MKKNIRNKIYTTIWWLLVVGACAVLFILPVSGNRFDSSLNQLAMIIVLLTIPYVILKIGFHLARGSDKNQQEFEIKDMPNDADKTKRKS